MKAAKAMAKYLSVILVIGLFALPMYWVLVSSFKPTPELLSLRPTLVPHRFTLEHYRNLFRQVDFLGYYRNSLIVASITAFVTALAAAFAAYSVYRCRYPGRKVLFRLFLISYIFPKILLLIPLYIMFAKIGIIDSPLAIVAAHVTLTAPFSVWILRAFFESVPKEVEEAALVDGANRVQVVLRVFIPLAAPGVAAVGINAFLMSWSEYLFASVLVISDQYKTLPVGMSFFLQQYAIDWGIMMAGSVLIAIPPVIGFAIAGRYFIQGLTAGSIK